MDKRDYDLYGLNELREVTLPKWLTDEFPEHLPHLVIRYDEGTFWVGTQTVAASLSNIVEAYDYARQFSEEAQVTFDPSVDGHGGELENRTFLLAPAQRKIVAETSHIGPLLHGSITEDLEDKVKEDYFTWLTKLSVEYNENPEDFMTAHKWLSHHPIFWTKDTEDESFLWTTDMGLSNMRISVFPDDKLGKPVVFLEHGPHDEEYYTDHHPDHRLFTLARTYEEAIIEMAKKVNAVFDLDGSERTPTSNRVAN